MKLVLLTYLDDFFFSAVICLMTTMVTKNAAGNKIVTTLPVLKSSKSVEMVILFKNSLQILSERKKITFEAKVTFLWRFL